MIRTSTVTLMGIMSKLKSTEGIVVAHGPNTLLKVKTGPIWVQKGDAKHDGLH